MSSQKHQPAAGSTCPSCQEPLERGDLFCGACGYDLSAVTVAPDDHPTIAIGTAGGWPEATGTDTAGTPTPVQLAGDLPGTDSGGAPLGEQPGGQLPAASVRFDASPGAASGGTSGAMAGASASGDFELPAPAPSPAPAPASVPAADPRAADLVTPPPPGAKVCVACRAGRVDTDGYCENCGHAQPRERDHMEQELGSVAAVSDRGLRHHRNEDSFAVSSTALPDGTPAVVAIVCDGVSSATRT